MLGLVRFDGQVYSAEKITRAVFLQIRLPMFMKVFSTFIFPKIEYDLPVFTCETVLLGKKRVFVVDAHAGGGGGEQDYSDFYDRLISIRRGYPDLIAVQKTSSSGIAALQSTAAVRIKIPRELDGQAIAVFTDYFGAYLELINAAEPVSGKILARLQASFQQYLKTVVDHDPGVKANSIFFGKKEGVERALDMYYDV